MTPQSRLEHIIDTSITLSYQAKAWGPDRIALDGIQNHLPSDSGGSKVEVEFEVDGKWVPFNKRRAINPSKVKAIRFSDDGKGFSYEMLELLYSTKSGSETVGQFGEGIKMLSTAALRSGI